LAASEKAGTPVWDVDASKATAVVIGSETHGVADELLSACNQQVTIPMLGRVGSLNAAVATGMLLYELRRGKVEG
jgi:tRNA G18 (ribose-2'-O)-methylase SpoU